MRVGLLSPKNLTDPTLYWMCRDLEAIPAVNVQASVVVPDIPHEQFAMIGGVAKSYLSSDREYDLLLIFDADEFGDEAARIVRKLDCREIVLCDSYDEDAIAFKVKAGLSFLSNRTVSSFEERVGGLGVFPMSKRKFFGGFALDAAAGAEELRRPGGGQGETVVFSLSEDEIEAVAPLLDNSFSAKEITILTKGSIKSSLMARNILCKSYAISEAPIDFILKNASRLIDLSDGISGDMHRYILYSALSRNAHVFCKKDLAESISFTPSFVGPGETREYFLSAINTIQNGRDRQVLPDKRFASMLESYREKITALLAASEPGGRKRGKSRGKKAGSRYCFLAINGNGLGHAQRVVSLAREIEKSKPAKKGSDIQVAAFGTCVDFVRANGFDVIPLLTRNGQAREPSIELVNFKRLSGSLTDAAAFVFDGGYPYDSVVGACQVFHGPKVWIRRGLWRDDQDNRHALDREKYFDRVIRPLEAFDELNGNLHPWRTDSDEIAVAPIVGDAYDKQVQQWAAKRRGKGKRLVVSMLGGGLISDRSNMLYSIARKLEEYDDVVHLAVSWPQAAYRAGVDRFANTQLVATNFGNSILSKADLYIGAAGYNTFHECVYHRLPAVYAPQSASWLDDQEARAAAAQERGIGVAVKDENLLAICRGIDFMLAGDGIKKCRNAFRTIELPEPGNRDAAKRIMEME
jgi:UDP:flavonoid glycosyltransferase YjiC (YdhE family)